MLMQLYAGLSGDVDLENTGPTYVISWGRVSADLRPNLLEAMVSVEDGGAGVA
ncbi:hypothetical protein GGR56DRAFT_24391 [Xylariaceae sp. FL0804]|nr:hypothetical protein GGR56DRAFT_24391 [Xylariaceae sp. FL0804]